MKKGNIISWVLIIIFLFSAMITSITIYWHLSNNKLTKIIDESSDKRQKIEEVYNEYVNNHVLSEIVFDVDGYVKINCDEEEYYLYEKNHFLLIERWKNG